MVIPYKSWTTPLKWKKKLPPSKKKSIIQIRYFPPKSSPSKNRNLPKEMPKRKTFPLSPPKIRRSQSIYIFYQTRPLSKSRNPPGKINAYKGSLSLKMLKNKKIHLPEKKIENSIQSFFPGQKILDKKVWSRYSNFFLEFPIFFLVARGFSNFSTSCTGMEVFFRHYNVENNEKSVPFLSKTEVQKVPYYTENQIILRYPLMAGVYSVHLLVSVHVPDSPFLATWPPIMVDLSWQTPARRKAIGADVSRYCVAPP